MIEAMCSSCAQLTKSTALGRAAQTMAQKPHSLKYADGLVPETGLFLIAE
jgi:hypothetical protein